MMCAGGRFFRSFARIGDAYGFVADPLGSGCSNPRTIPYRAFDSTKPSAVNSLYDGVSIAASVTG